MKKFLSLVLALVMALGCLTVPAFADNFELYVGNVQVTAKGELDHATFQAIKSGTVTYTPASGGNPAKLTLNNAVIEYAADSIGTGSYVIYDASSDSLVIELIGTSSVLASSGNGICSNPLTIIGSGNLNVSTAGGYGIFSSGMLTFSMTGTVTATGGNWGSISANGGFTVTEGAGKIIARANANDDTYAFSLNTDSLTVDIPEDYTIVGSTDLNATDEAQMTDVTWSESDGYSKIGEAKAKTVVIYNPNAKPAEEGTSGTTTITAVKEEPEIKYTISIPTNVAKITNFGVYQVGQAKVTGVQNATDNTVISYTATTTDFKCSGKSDLPATYYTEQAATNAFPTTAVKVYENKAEAASIPSMWVKIAESDWDAAAAGTYTATVTYNFSAEEVEKVTIADILPEEFPGSSSDSWWRGAYACALYATGGNLCAKGDYTVSVPVTTVLAPASGDYDYTCTVDGITWKFAMSGDEFCKVNISGAQGDHWEVNGDYSEVD